MPLCCVSDRYRFIYVPVENGAAQRVRAELTKPVYACRECSFDAVEAQARQDYFTFAVLQEPMAWASRAYQEILARHCDGMIEEQALDPLVAPQSAQLEGIRIDRYVDAAFLRQDVAEILAELGIPNQPAWHDPDPDDAEPRAGGQAVWPDHETELIGPARNLFHRLYEQDFKLFYETVTRSHARSGRLLRWFQERNNRPGEVFVYRLGSRGFFAELTTVARAILYCVDHDLRLVIDSREFAYRRAHGWTDYFQPFCPDLADYPHLPVDIDCHSNIRGPGTVFDRLLAHNPECTALGGLHIHRFDAILGVLLTMIFRLSDETARDVNRTIQDCNLPDSFASIHIRRGDKVGDEDVLYPTDFYLNRLAEHGAANLPLFILSDDHRSVLETQAALKRRRSPHPVYALCDVQHRGFSVDALRRETHVFTHEGASPSRSTSAEEPSFREHVGSETVRLLAETVIASRSECFIGTYRSNIGRSIWYLHDRPGRCVLLTERDLQEPEPARESI